MEDLLVFLLQGIVEILGWIAEGAGTFLWEAINWNCAGDLLDLIFRSIAYLMRSFAESWPAMSENVQAGWISTAYFIVGLAAGTVSLHLHHDVFFRRSASRLLALALGPLFTGTVSWLNAKLEIFFRTTARPAYCFWWALFFAFGLSMVRFGFCHRIV